MFWTQMSQMFISVCVFFVCLILGKKPQKVTPFQVLLHNTFKSKVPFRKVSEIKSELSSLYLRSHQLAEENGINDFSEVDWSQMQGNSSEIFSCSMNLSPQCGMGVSREGSTQSCPRNRQELPGAEGTWILLSSSIQGEDCTIPSAQSQPLWFISVDAKTPFWKSKCII